ncbi:hypothetical protein SSBR45G_46620 [Bradyrhizobium sp. SSBR45G]|uniref:hypothetical protein n=1 Tax=unclassified Bradyrhizobium TaxID=2631580 RepID=UPI002342A8DA|nr:MULTISPECIES: hypothetical protein [unclassified Bradyrhizobium]GLH79753.1 hypothetical protein SSBR45G_46620 [Bradyrhizobium sp. SSBR45G]GLH87129.1 hypothetical protein SSBR45R_45890 [Bradyrhizobium sp. SSBR45R]
MSRSWPNTAVWQLVEQQLKMSYGSCWRPGGEHLFGLPPGALRANIDRFMTEPEIRAVEGVIKAHLLRRVEQTKELLAFAEQRAADVADEFLTLRSHLDDGPDELTLLLQLVDLSPAYSEEDREATKAHLIEQANAA